MATDITTLPLATAVDGSETLAGVQAGTTKGIRAGLIMAGSASQSTQSANTVFAGPSTGAAATPTFRALVAADFSVVWPVSQGGTGLASGTSGGILGYTATGTLASSVALTASALVLGGGAGATPTPMASLGTTTTVLHGNAAGAPTFGAVVLTTDVSGTLPTANGGTGVTSLGTISRTDDTNVTLTLGGTPTNSTIQSVSFTMGWTGQLGLTRGGTAASLTASNGGIIYSTASAMAVLSGTATAGQHLVSGSSAAPSWSTSTYPSTSAAGTVLASLTANTITASAAPVLGIPGTTMGTLALSGSTSGTVSITPQATAGSPTLTLPNTTGTIAASATAPITLNATTGAIGVTAAALTRTDDTNVTLTLGGTPTTALLAATSLTLGWTGTLAVARGGTGLSAGTSGGILGYTATGTLASSVALTASALVLGGGAGATPTPMASLGTTTTVLHGNAAGAPTFGAVVLTADVSGTLPVANGGTGITSLGTGIATWLGTPSSANLLAAVTDETGTGALVFGTSPSLTTSALLSSGFILNWAAGNGTATHSTGLLTWDGLGQVFNEAGADLDFRIEGDTISSLFFADASTDRIGFGTAAPTFEWDFERTIAGRTAIQIANASTDAAAYSQIRIGSNAGAMHFQTNSTAGGGAAALYSSATGNTSIYTTGATALRFGTNSNDSRLTFDGTTGAVTIGVSLDVTGAAQMDSLRIDQAATAIGTGTKTISNAADSSTNFGKYFSISLNGTTVYIPCSTVAPT